jgi:hypothetical protein
LLCFALLLLCFAFFGHALFRALTASLGRKLAFIVGKKKGVAVSSI